ncbi:hypothetical protein BpHYR1_037309 [Brachionus plicatilis]|uniref:Uncharacterized protein n=1 Tax=Brachionus plicatilis TaxID=10195 RepID=A0A3M7RXX7_BRAPC|nr:hypothetical protein BpHYR1_037309 [Brachionus plicatilis]
MIPDSYPKKANSPNPKDYRSVMSEVVKLKIKQQSGFRKNRDNFIHFLQKTIETFERKRKVCATPSDNICFLGKRFEFQKSGRNQKLIFGFILCNQKICEKKFGCSCLKYRPYRNQYKTRTRENLIDSDLKGQTFVCFIDFYDKK